MFTVVKRYKRLHIVDAEDRSVYTPPDFVQPPSREAMHVLAGDFNDRGCRDIDAIVRFESAHTKKRRSVRYN